MPRLVDAFEQFFDSSGEVLASGLVDFFESGSNTVRKTTYADSGETIPNPNPVVLNGDGRAPNVWGSGTYRAVLRTADGDQILSRDPVGGDNNLAFGADWNALQVYSISDVVRDDGQYWISQTNNNLGNQPSTDGGTNWIQIVVDFQDVVSQLFYGSYAEVRDINTSTLSDGQMIFISGFGHPWEVATGTETDDGYYLVFNDDSNRYAKYTGESVDIRVFGGVLDGATDDYTAIQASLDRLSYAIIPNTGSTTTCVCNTMITLGGEQIIFIGNDTLLREFTGTSDPVIWCKGERSGVVGQSFSSSRVMKATAASVATIVIGVIDYAVQTNSSDRCFVSRVRISGAANQGATSGTAYAALAVWNPQISGSTSYFHQVNDVMVENCNYGIHLRGNANAANYSNIHLFRTGDRTVLAGAGFYMDGALENQLVNLFHHDADNSDSLYMINNCRYNSIQNFVCEQGGASARGIVTDDTGSNNHIQLHNNVAGGNNIGSTFQTTNTISLPQVSYIPEIRSPDVQADVLQTDLISTLTAGAAIAAKSDQTGDFSFTIGGLRPVSGSVYYRVTGFLVYSGVETDSTGSFDNVVQFGVRGFNTYNTLTVNDITGTATLAVSNDTTTGFDIDITVTDAASISNAILILAGNGSNQTTIV